MSPWVLTKQVILLTGLFYGQLTTECLAKMNYSTENVLKLAENQSNRLMILPFENNLKNKDIAIGNAALDAFQSSLLSSKFKPFRVIDRKKLKAILVEQAFSESSLTDPTNALKIGNLLSANYMLSGNIASGKIHTSEVTIQQPTEYTWATINVNVTLTEIETGEILFSAKTTQESSHYPDWKGDTYTSILIEAAEKAATHLAETLIQERKQGNG